MERRTDRELICLVQRILAHIRRGELERLAPLCTADALLKYDHQCRPLKQYINAKVLQPPMETDGQWGGKNQHIQYLNGGNTLITGLYEEKRHDDAGREIHGYDYTVLFFGQKASYIQITFLSDPAKVHRVVAVDRAVYWVRESDLLYLEVFRNHLHWHCCGRIIESVGTLSGIQIHLSEDFIRVHRCYIVNRNCVETICRFGVKRCAVVMTNGDEIPIPYRKYVECRRMLCR